MTLDANGNWRLAPDAAPGSPHFNNIYIFPYTDMARCNADDLEPMSVSHVAGIENALRHEPDGEAKTVMLSLCRSVRLLHAELAFMRGEKHTLEVRIAELDRGTEPPVEP